MKTRVAIVGATGYTAIEAIKLLLRRHPLVESTAVTSRSDEGKPISDIHPALAQRLPLKLERLMHNNSQLARTLHLVVCRMARRQRTVRETLPSGLEGH